MIKVKETRVESQYIDPNSLHFFKMKNNKSNPSAKKKRRAKCTQGTYKQEDPLLISVKLHLQHRNRSLQYNFVQIICHALKKTNGDTINNALHTKELLTDQ